MNHPLLDSLMHISLNAPIISEFDPSDYTNDYVLSHDKCDNDVSPRKKPPNPKYEKDDDDEEYYYDFEKNELNKKYKLGQSALF